MTTTEAEAIYLVTIGMVRGHGPLTRQYLTAVCKRVLCDSITADDIDAVLNEVIDDRQLQQFEATSSDGISLQRS